MNHQSSPAPMPRKQDSGLLGRVLRRFFLVLITAALLVSGALALVMDHVFHGPSPAAIELLTVSLSDSGLTGWLPPLFLGEDAVGQILAGQEG